MKAAVYYTNGGPEVFRYEDVSDPLIGPRQILIKVEAISIEGGDSINREVGPLVNTPHIVGYQCAGTVIEVGHDVRTRSVGDRVVAILPWGSHAEMAAAEESDTWVLPSGLDPFKAAAIPVAWGTAHECLFEFGKLEAGQTVLVHAAAGALGIAAIQLAKGAGAFVIGTASSNVRLERLQALGLDLGVNYGQEDFVDAVMKATSANGVNLVIDSVGGSNLSASIRALSYRGKVITVGRSGRDSERPDPVSLWRGNKSMQGVFFPNSLDNEHKRVHQMVAGILTSVANDELNVVIDKVFPLSEASAAHEYVMSRTAFGRVMMQP